MNTKYIFCRTNGYKLRFHAHFQVNVEFIQIIHTLSEEHSYAQFVPIMDNIFDKVENSFNIELKPIQNKV